MHGQLAPVVPMCRIFAVPTSGAHVSAHTLTEDESDNCTVLSTHQVQSPTAWELYMESSSIAAGRGRQYLSDNVQLLPYASFPDMLPLQYIVYDPSNPAEQVSSCNDRPEHSAVLRDQKW